jgi:putative transcriptional regulator
MATKMRKKLTTRKTSGFGQAVLASLRDWERGGTVTVRHVVAIPEPKARRSNDVKRLRTKTLGVSQTVFARLLGVSPKLVEAWEANRNAPAGPVRRLFELIERDPRGFLGRYTKGAA